MKRFGIVAAFAGLVAAVALAGAMFVSSSGESDSDQATVDDIQGITWTLTSWSASSPLPGVPIVLEIVDGMVSGDSACNSYYGPITFDGQSIVVGGLLRTMMFCEATSEAETTYVELLDEVTTWRLDGEDLVLGIGDEESLRFAS